jgi:hypothetical protein
MKTILFILQNAYKSDKYNFRNEDEWFRDLKRSHTGRILKKVIPDNCKVMVINSSKFIGNNPNSYCIADTDYILEKLKLYKPDIICACGFVAHHGLEVLGIEHYSMPHPAYRAFSNKLAEIIKNDLTNLILPQ